MVRTRQTILEDFHCVLTSGILDAIHIFKIPGIPLLLPKMYSLLQICTHLDFRNKSMNYLILYYMLAIYYTLFIPIHHLLTLGEGFSLFWALLVFWWGTWAT